LTNQLILVNVGAVNGEALTGRPGRGRAPQGGLQDVVAEVARRPRCAIPKEER